MYTYFVYVRAYMYIACAHFRINIEQIAMPKAMTHLRLLLSHLGIAVFSILLSYSQEILSIQCIEF